MINIYPASDGEPSQPVALGFATDDLDALHEGLTAAGVEVVRAPVKKPWGQMATYRDPDGNLVSVSQRPR
jgi:predicted enzyme related to lactoylglutathione lyase